MPVLLAPESLTQEDLNFRTAWTEDPLLFLGCEPSLYHVSHFSSKDSLSSTEQINRVCAKLLQIQHNFCNIISHSPHDST